MKIKALSAFAVVMALSFAFYGCGSLKKMVKNHPTMAKYEAKPNPLEMKGDKVAVTITGTYQPKYFNKKAGVIFQPELKYEGGSVMLPPYALKGESVKKGAGTTISNANGGEFTYTATIDYKPEMEQSQLVVNPSAFFADKVKDPQPQPQTAEEAAALKKAVKLGETPLAEGMNVTANRLSNEAAPSFVADKYEKETILAQSATIFYIVDQYNLDWNWKFNKDTANKNKITALEKALSSDMAIKTIKIGAWASPEGEESRNQNLSDNRGKTAEKYLKDTYNKIIDKKAKALKVKPASIKKELPISIAANGEDWDGFVADLKASDIKEKNTIINVISSQKDRAAREQEIRNMTVIYQQIEDKILPSLRRAVIDIEFLEPKKTDEQIALLSTSAPDSLKLEELLYAATLTNDNDTKLKIYTSATNIYAEDWRAFNNVGYINIQKKDYDAAQTALNKANSMEPNNGDVLNNLGVVALAKNDYKNAKSYFESAVKAGNKEAKANLGILNIKEGNYTEAANAMSEQKCTYNLGLSLLMDKKVDEAKTTLMCAPQDAKTLYLIAVCNARNKDQAGTVDYLKKAIQQDASLKTQASKDVEFKEFRASAEFQNVVK